MSEGGNGKVEFSAYDSSNTAFEIVTLRTTSIPITIKLGINTGIQLPHRSSRPISAQNLTFYSNFFEIPLKYLIVDQPEFGLIECYRFYNITEHKLNIDKNAKNIKEDGNFQLCSQFDQSDIDLFKIRYRHLSTNRPQSDSFSFQVIVVQFIIY